MGGIPSLLSPQGPYGIKTEIRRARENGRNVIPLGKGGHPKYLAHPRTQIPPPTKHVQNTITTAHTKNINNWEMGRLYQMLFLLIIKGQVD